MIASQHGVSRNLLFQWRKQYRSGKLSAGRGGEEVVPATALADALRQIQELQRLLERKTLESELLREIVESGQMKAEMVGSPLLQVSGDEVGS